MPTLDKIAVLAQSAAPNRGALDLAAWKQWKSSKSDKDLSSLIDRVTPLVHREANKWSSALARPLLEAEGKRLAVEAFHNFDPKGGAALATHVVNRLQKMSRLSYANQNVARLPENKMLMYHTYNLGHSELQDRLGRGPTVDELADHLGWSMKHLTQFRTQIGRQELLESGGNATTDGNAGDMFDADDQDHTVDFIHHDLPPLHKAIFEHLTGYGGAKILDNQEIMAKLKLTQGQYSYAKKNLIAQVKSVQEGKR